MSRLLRCSARSEALEGLVLIAHRSRQKDDVEGGIGEVVFGVLVGVGGHATQRPLVGAVSSPRQGERDVPLEVVTELPDDVGRERVRGRRAPVQRRCV